MTNMLLDFAKQNTGLLEAKDVVESVLPSDVIGTVVQTKLDDILPVGLDYIIKVFESKGMYILDDELSESFDAEFVKYFDSIKGFHACRLKEEESYRNEGLKVLDVDRLFDLALDRYGEYASKERIREACENARESRFDSGVYFFVTLETTTDKTHNHYLKCGCETLSGVAGELGLAYQGILASQGRPCAIECNIPIHQICRSFRYDIWNKLINVHFRNAISTSTKEEFPADSCFSTTGDVSSECIQTFHYIDDSEFEYNLPLH